MTSRTSGLTAALVVIAASGCGGEELFSLGRDQRDLGADARARILADDQRLDSATVVGDLDGDGIDDAIVNASFVDASGGLHVRLYVVYGSELHGDITLEGLPVLLSDPFGPNIDVEPVGDVNGDGLAD